MQHKTMGKLIAFLNRQDRFLLFFIGIIMLVVLTMLVIQNKPMQVETVKELSLLFDEHQYSWPPDQAVPTLFVEQFPDDMNALQGKERKSVFFRTVLPLILEENASITADRAMLINAIQHNKLHEKTTSELKQLARKYGIEDGLQIKDIQQQLMRRIDVIPVELALAQAANESAWGTSRFTKEGNNLFGEWTYKQAEGLLPKERAKGKKHHVRKFKDLQSSIRSYMNNLNRGHAYQAFRKMRATMRKNNVNLDGNYLATGLSRYSERRLDYVDEIRAIIRQNELNKLYISK